MEQMHLCTSDDDGDRYSDYKINEDDDDDAEVVNDDVEFHDSRALPLTTQQVTKPNWVLTAFIYHLLVLRIISPYDCDDIILTTGDVMIIVDDYDYDHIDEQAFE